MGCRLPSSTVRLTSVVLAKGIQSGESTGAGPPYDWLVYHKRGFFGEIICIKLLC